MSGSGGPDAASPAYDAFARRITASGVITDPWVLGAPRFREEPVVVTATEARAMYRVAEAVAEVYNELCLLVADEPELLDSFFGLSPYQKAMWMASQPLWHVLARADVFVTDEGLADRRAELRHADRRSRGHRPRSARGACRHDGAKP